jgi:sulfur-oxidizing protein SoxY
VLRVTAPALAMVLFAAPAAASGPDSDPAPDPLRSVMWSDMRALLLGGGPVMFDERVRVAAPASAEDALNVPVMVDASSLDARGKVEEIVVFADMNPIPRILNYRPSHAKPLIGLRLKLQQATPIRAAARTPDGVWHVGGVFVDAAGGGCTSPALAHGDPQWERHLGEVQARAWEQAGDGAVRLRFRVRHPMDTGLAPGIPAFHLENLVIRDAGGRELGRIDTFEPVAENPVFTLEVSPAADTRSLRLTGRDNNGTSVLAEIPLPWRQSALPWRRSAPP